MPERMDEDQLKALISQEIRAADSFYTSELSSTRTRNMEYYQGTMVDTPAPVGKSSIVSRDVADVIGWILPGIIRVFTASDRIAEFDPVSPEDEEAAKQATDFINYVFLKDNCGYRVMWDATHDSLLLGNGIVKHYWDDTEDCEYAEMSGQTELQIALLLSENPEQGKPTVEILSQKPGEPQKITVPGPDGQPVEQDIPTWDIKIKRVKSFGRICIECIEPENFLKDKWSTEIKGSRFAAHRDPNVTKSDLVEMGFDKDIVAELPIWHTYDYSSETQARSTDWEHRANVGDSSMQRVELYECYIRADMDGDGIAETVRAYYAADRLLDWEVWDDDLPFSDIPCEPVPHRWDARSVADETVDIQRVKTVFLRGAANNLYSLTTPMQEAEEGQVVNPEMLITPKFGGVIWRKKGSLPIVTHQTPVVFDKLIAGLEYLDQVIERRTGVSRATMALDPQALQNQTATANQNQRDAAYSQIELIARNQAEGWRNVFKALLRLATKHQDRPRTIRLRNQWVDVDPRFWNSDMDATINVGLGTGSRDRDMAMLNNIQQTQVGIAEIFREAGAIDKAVGMIPKIVKSATRTAESAGLRNPDDYYPELTDQDTQAMIQNAQQMAAQGDPKVAAEKEMAQAQMQIDVQKHQMDAQLKREEMQQKLILQREQMVGELTLKREQLQAELALKAQLESRRLEIQREQGFYKTDKMVSTKTSGVHPGGQPG